MPVFSQWDPSSNSTICQCATNRNAGTSRRLAVLCTVDLGTVCEGPKSFSPADRSSWFNLWRSEILLSCRQGLWSNLWRPAVLLSCRQELLVQSVNRWQAFFQRQAVHHMSFLSMPYTFLHFLASPRSFLGGDREASRSSQLRLLMEDTLSSRVVTAPTHTWVLWRPWPLGQT